MRARHSLSPMQQGMLYHYLAEARPGTDVEQITCALLEEVQVPMLRGAWERVMQRHAVLRTRFVWDGLAEPRQEAMEQVELSLRTHDWSECSESKQEDLFNSFLQEDRTAGFNLARAPLLRLALIRLEDANYRLVWTFHHALLDGRSFLMVLKEVFRIYDALCQGEELEMESPRPYSDYIEWLRTQDWRQAERFWRHSLAGFTDSTRLVVDRKIRESRSLSLVYAERECRISSELTDALKALASQYEVTLSTIVQTAWAVLLSRYSGEEDVLFGATRACRHSALSGGESMVGLFINTLPVRAHVPPETPLPVCLRNLRAQQVAVRPYEHTPLALVQSWSEIPKGKQLFETLLVFENYLLDNALRAQGGNWLRRSFHLKEQPIYPLTIYAFAEPELIIRLAYDLSRFEPDTIGRMLGHLQTLLEAMVHKPSECLAALPILTEPERQKILFEWNDSKSKCQSAQCIHQAIEAQVRKKAGLSLSVLINIFGCYVSDIVELAPVF